MQPSIIEKLSWNDTAVWLRSRWIVVATIILAAAIGTIVGARLDTRIGDLVLTQSDRWHQADKDIVIVTITEDTLASLPYRSPLDRKFLSEVVAHIDLAGPRAIGIDILIDQASEPAKDERLIATLRSAKSPIIMAFATSGDGLTDKQSNHVKQALDGLRLGRVTLVRDGFDGTIRHWGDDVLPSSTLPAGFAYAIAKAAGRSPTAPSDRIVFYSDRSGAPLAFPMYPAHTVRLLPKQWFKDKFVLIGSTIPNLDQHRTPFVSALGIEDGSMHGIVVHAHMLTQLLQGDHIAPFGLLATLLYGLMLAAIAAGIMTASVSLTIRLVGVTILLAVTTAIALAGHNLMATEIPLAAPLAATVLTAAVLALQSWYQDRSQRLFIQRAFSQYVSPAVVDRIAADHSSLRLGGESRTVTYVFTDLEGFTTLSENLEPDKVATLLNAYLNDVCALFIDHGATIDKIIGDAVAGFFGAPSQQADQAERAVSLALAIDDFSEAFRKRHSQDGIALGVTRIGVHKGRAIIGNFGGSRFFDYTGIGDTVNTAARMEGANKYFGTRVCVSDSVAAEATAFDYRPVGDVIFKGKTDPIRCLEPVAPGSLGTVDVAGYGKAFALLDQRRDGAAGAFRKLHESDPDDPLIGFHWQRLQNGDHGVKIILSDK